jgi:predicted DNA-binding transcriptional regulator AlpA
MQTTTPQNTQTDRVLPLSEFAALADISMSTLSRLRAEGQGPTVTRLSARRLGVRASDAEAWLRARAQAPSAVA